MLLTRRCLLSAVLNEEESDTALAAMRAAAEQRTTYEEADTGDVSPPKGGRMLRALFADDSPLSRARPCCPHLLLLLSSPFVCSENREPPAPHQRVFRHPGGRRPGGAGRAQSGRRRECVLQAHVWATARRMRARVSPSSLIPLSCHPRHHHTAVDVATLDTEMPLMTGPEVSAAYHAWAAAERPDSAYILHR